MDKGLALMFVLSAMGIVVFGAILLWTWTERENYDDKEEDDEWWG